MAPLALHAKEGVFSLRQIFACLLVLWLPSTALANDWDAIRDPDAILLMRHALAPGTGDPAGFDLAECGTQRNLDERGREQARSIGAALKERGVDSDAVWTSQWCRCRETAKLLDLGEVTEIPPLEFAFSAAEGDGDAQTAAVMEMLRDQRAARPCS